MMPGDMPKAALSFAGAGWPVFPCKRGKSPYTTRGFKDATREPTRITEWWTRWPGASIGLATGFASGVWVLDVDRPKKPGAPDGFDTLAALETEHGRLPATLVQETGGGGRQYFFKCPAAVKIGNSASKIGPGIDVRGEGGYVILPPSGHPSGNSYRWIDESEPAEAPEWLIGLVIGKTKPPATHPLGSEISSKYGEAALAGELATLAEASEGQRNDALNRAAFRLGQLVVSGELDRGQVETELYVAARSIGLSEDEIQRTIQSGLEKGLTSPRSAPEVFTAYHAGGADTTESEAWDYVRKIFPRVPYPWDVLPDAIAHSFQQMGRAFATSPEPIPGAACAVVASLLGSTVAVSPKSSWEEPLIFWFGDIRPSGSGKTPAPRALCKVLYAAQKDADELYRAACSVWELAKPKDRGPQPERARGYFMTGLTLEGVRVDSSGHGGAVAILDEVSALISMQNEYKKDGSDREAWLCLHDGNPARIVRAKDTKTIRNSRLSIFGGIQPGVWRKVFGGKDGVYLEDGTAFRMLLTYGGDAFYPQTAETWSEENRNQWENLLRRAVDWADLQHLDKEQVMRLSEDAQTLFFDWRNDLYSHLPHLPGTLKGFIPKAVGYALRLAGVIHCLRCFTDGKTPQSVLTAEDMERGIKAVSFYLGQTVDAACSLVSKEAVHVEDLTPQARHLGQALESLRGDVDNGHLAIGFICERYNGTRPYGVDEVSSRLLGNLLRHAGLTVPEQRVRCNGKTGIRGLKWDEKTESFLRAMSTTSNISTSLVMEPICDDGRSFSNVHNVHQTDRADGGFDGHDGRCFSTSINAKPHECKARGHDGHCGRCQEENSKNEIDGEAQLERQAIQEEVGNEW